MYFSGNDVGFICFTPPQLVSYSWYIHHFSRFIAFAQSIRFFVFIEPQSICEFVFILLKFDFLSYLAAHGILENFRLKEFWSRTVGQGANKRWRYKVFKISTTYLYTLTTVTTKPIFTKHLLSDSVCYDNQKSLFYTIICFTKVLFILEKLE